MNRKEFLKRLGMLTVGASLIGVDVKAMTAESASAADATVATMSTVKDYSVVEKNGAVLSSANDVYYSSEAGSRASFTVTLGTSTDLVFTRAYYYNRTNQLVNLVDSSTGNQSSVEFEYVIYTNKAEVELTVYYTTTTNSKEQSIELESKLYAEIKQCEYPASIGVFYYPENNLTRYEIKVTPSSEWNSIPVVTNATEFQSLYLIVHKFIKGFNAASL